METEKKLSLRTARYFGFDIADQVAEMFENRDIAANDWPKKFPINFKELDDHEVFKNTDKKILERVYEAACISWEGIRLTAIEFEDVDEEMLNDEYDLEYDFNVEEFQKERAWPNLLIELQYASGELQCTEYDTEEENKQAVKNMLGLDSLNKIKHFLPEDDYIDFIKEAREHIRSSFLRASEKFELICQLHENNQNTK